MWAFILCIFECVPKRIYLNDIGDDDVRGTPVPMPNTEVKPYDAEDTLGEISGENMELPIFVYSSLAQSVERTAVNRDVVGSSPTRGAILRNNGSC